MAMHNAARRLTALLALPVGELYRLAPGDTGAWWGEISQLKRVARCADSNW